MKINWSNKLKHIFFLLLLIYSLFTVLHIVFSGSMSFWIDPGRDLLQALDNLKKPTLIGPPSGIPGLFYGPYWIWLLSGGLLLSKDPRFLVFLILTIPYFTLFPYLLKKFYPKNHIWILLFFLFVIQHNIYFTQLWNVHPAPLLFLLLLALILKKINYTETRNNLLLVFFTGFVAGLVINFHVSFGIGVFVGTVLFLIVDYLLNRKKTINIFILPKILFVLSLGFLTAFIPMFIFEFRHGFNQFQALHYTITNAVLYNSAVVGQVGLSKSLMIQFFIGKFGDILQVKGIYANMVGIFILLFFVSKLFKKEISITVSEKRMLLLLFCISTVILFIFLSSKNPVWAYHFMGVEIIMMLLIGFLLTKLTIFRKLLIFWVLVILISNAYSYMKTFSFNPRILTSYATKRYIVEKIFNDTEGKKFSVYIYSPSIYTYEYDYLFKWLGDEYKNFPTTLDDSSATYLVIPETSKSVYDDFINYKTPNQNYKTIQKWNIEDGTTILKRLKNI